MEDNTTPEEKLLKIIENPEDIKRKISQKQKEKASLTKTNNFPWQALGGLHIGKDMFSGLSLKFVNRVVLGLCVIFSIFAVFDFLRSGGNLKKQTSAIIKEASMPDISGKKIPGVSLNIGEASSGTETHNIFSLLPPAPAGPEAVSAGFTQITSVLRLAGIIWSEVPEAMIENTKENHTYLLKKGDTLNTQVKVKEISRSSVILEITAPEGLKEYELR